MSHLTSLHIVVSAVAGALSALGCVSQGVADWTGSGVSGFMTTLGLLVLGMAVFWSIYEGYIKWLAIAVAMVCGVALQFLVDTGFVHALVPFAVSVSSWSAGFVVIFRRSRAVDREV